MRLGVIDIGSNTVHALIVDAHRGARPLPTASHQSALRLSEHLRDDGSIDEPGVEALVTFTEESLDLAENEGAEEVLAFATSAIREATNGPEVVERLSAASGLDNRQ